MISQGGHIVKVTVECVFGVNVEANISEAEARMRLEAFIQENIEYRIRSEIATKTTSIKISNLELLDE